MYDRLIFKCISCWLSFNEEVKLYTDYECTYFQAHDKVQYKQEYSAKIKNSFCSMYLILNS